VEINGGTFNIYAPSAATSSPATARAGQVRLEEFLEYKAMQFRPAPKA